MHITSTEQLMKDGDVGGVAVWRRIVAAIEALRRDRSKGKPGIESLAALDRLGA
jgi:hypothetical protein